MAILTHLLTLMFAMSSWMGVNGVWVELPLLVTELQERWYLPVYVLIIIQTANIAPFFISVMHKLKPGLVREAPVNYVVVSISTVVCFLLAFLWHYSTRVAGNLHSTSFFVLTFFLSVASCTSNVTFLPFMSRFHSCYVTTFFVGVGFSRLIPAIMALPQGSGVAHCVHSATANHNITTNNTTFGNGTARDAPSPLVTHYSPPNFSIMVFFLIMAIMSLACLVAFFFLNRVPRVWELSEQKLCASEITLNSVQKIPVDGKATTQIRTFTNYPVIEKPGSSARGEEAAHSGTIIFTRSNLAFMYVLLAWTFILISGVLPAVQSYSTLPYTNQAFHLSVTLSSVANPLACIIAMLLPNRSLRLLGVLSAIGTVFAAYILGMAVMSPCPLLHNSAWGEAIIVISWILFTGFISYVQVMLGVILRSHSHSALVWFGAVQQLGALVGAMIMFPLVSIYDLFKSADFCNFHCPA